MRVTFKPTNQVNLFKKIAGIVRELDHEEFPDDSWELTTQELWVETQWGGWVYATPDGLVSLGGPRNILVHNPLASRFHELMRLAEDAGEYAVEDYQTTRPDWPWWFASDHAHIVDKFYCEVCRYVWVADQARPPACPNCGGSNWT